MNEGWHLNDYLILFSPGERPTVTEQYRLSQYIPGYSVVGLKGWDDFILTDGAGRTVTLPTFPLDPSYAEPFQLPGADELRADSRFEGKIKWYVKPIVFGGEHQDVQNVAWVTHEQHRQLVVWWNEQYKAQKSAVQSEA